jgi:F-type H+-transporting ATPase subunit a
MNAAAFRHRLTGRSIVLLALAFALLGWRVSTACAEPEPAGHAKEAHKSTAAPHPHVHKHPTAVEHVMDAKHEWEFFHSFGSPWSLPEYMPGKHVTKFMILEVIAAGLVLVIYVPLARRLRDGTPPQGAWDNAFESLLTFIREKVAKPNLGEHDADRFVPFLWTLFLFILFNNLLGMLPFGGSPTASIFVTGGLAVVVFFAIHGSAIAKMGFVHYIQSLWPHIDVPFPLGYVIKPVVFIIEVVGVLVRNAVLAVRLFANMFAGHMVLATILIFIYTAGRVAQVGFALWATITFSSVLGIVTLSLLEIFVAFLQAFIFVFLASLFMGMAMHPQH